MLNTYLLKTSTPNAVLPTRGSTLHQNPSSREVVPLTNAPLPQSSAGFEFRQPGQLRFRRPFGWGVDCLLFVFWLSWDRARLWRIEYDYDWRAKG